MGIASKIARIAAKYATKKPSKVKTDSRTPKQKHRDIIAKRKKQETNRSKLSTSANVKGPITRGKKDLRKILGRPLNTKAEKVVGKRTKVPFKGVTDEMLAKPRKLGLDQYITHDGKKGKLPKMELMGLLTRMMKDMKLKKK